MKPACSFDDFEKVDIRVGKVLECEKVKKSKKLLKFKIDDGMGGRTILSGIAGSYPEPEKLVGMEVLFIANFAPRNMMGHESQGMILSAVNPDGSLTPRGEDVIRQTPFKRFGKPEELCGTIQYLISDASSFVTGSVAVVDGGFNVFAM